MQFGFGFILDDVGLYPFLLPATDFMNAFWHCIGAIYFLVDTLDPFFSMYGGDGEGQGRIKFRFI
jgi:hypothetical protein